MSTELQITKLGKLLRAAREKYGLSLRKASELSGIHRNNILLMEHGKIPNPGLAPLAKLVRVYRTTLSKLLRKIE